MVWLKVGAVAPVHRAGLPTLIGSIGSCYGLTLRFDQGRDGDGGLQVGPADLTLLCETDMFHT